MKIGTAIIPCAGLGTRLLPLTWEVPKELLPVGCKPALHRVIEEALRLGVRDIIIVINPLKQSIIRYLRPSRHLIIRLLRDEKNSQKIRQLKQIWDGARYHIVYQKVARGLGDAILRAKSFFKKRDDPFLVLLPDILLEDGGETTDKLVGACLESEIWGTLLKKIGKGSVSSYGIVDAKCVSKERFQIMGAVEKPNQNEAPSDLGILGRYVFNPDIFDYLSEMKPGVFGEVQLTDAMHAMAQKSPGRGVVYCGKVFDIGTPEGLAEASLYFLKKNQRGEKKK